MFNKTFFEKITDPHQKCSGFGCNECCGTGRWIWDREEMDGTEAAHPAWWRGHNYGVVDACNMIGRIIYSPWSEGIIAGDCNEPLQKIREEVFKLRRDSIYLEHIERASESEYKELSELRRLCQELREILVKWDKKIGIL